MVFWFWNGSDYVGYSCEYFGGSFLYIEKVISYKYLR